MILMRTGGQSGSGNSSASSAGIQKRRKSSPMGVPGPVRVSSSLSSRVSMASSRLLKTQCLPEPSLQLAGMV